MERIHRKLYRQNENMNEVFIEKKFEEWSWKMKFGVLAIGYVMRRGRLEKDVMLGIINDN